MKLMKSIIENKLHYFDELEINNKVNFWNFFQAVNLVYPFSKIEAKFRNSIWLKVLQNHQKSILIMRQLIYKDRKRVYDYLSKLMEQAGMEEKVGNFWKKGKFAVADYEYDRRY